jgi:hypothetical protein
MSTSRSTNPLSPSLIHNLNLYAVGATAAGVSVLALASSSEAKIVYTPKHRVIRSGHTLSLDLNHDKISDFILSNRIFSTTDVWGRTLRVLPNSSGNQVVGKKGLGLVYYAYALSKGATIGPKQPFSGKVMAASGMEYGYVGPWRNVSDRYLGVKFQANRKTHYGWVRLSVRTTNSQITATLKGYAYETIPNKPIIAGKTKGPDVVTVPTDTRTGTLGQLALGRK